MTRKKIDIETEAKVLRYSRRRCCICFGLNRDTSIKQGQIAHLNKNPNNNILDNLVFLCLDHHDQFDSTTSQSKNFTMVEVREYRKELYESIEKAWKLPITFEEITTEPISKIAGHYIREGKFDNAEFDIAYLGDNKIQVKGFALWGIKEEYGPNIGEIDFESAIAGNKISFVDKIADNQEYRLELEFSENGLSAREDYIIGYYGMNVSFQGEYKKILVPDIIECRYCGEGDALPMATPKEYESRGILWYKCNYCGIRNQYSIKNNDVI